MTGPVVPSVLLLGGTTEARTLADSLAADGWAVITSLAGRTSAPDRPAGQVRIGGFGGPDGLSDWLRTHRPTCLVDATHPFATRMSATAARVSAAQGVPLLRVRRPAWAQTHPDATRWVWARDHADAVHRVLQVIPTPDLPGTVLLTVGRQQTGAYIPALDTHAVLARVAEGRGLQLPAAWRLIVDRGPFSLQAERALFSAASVRVLVSKDSGGEATAAKLAAAREVGATVVMIHRPPEASTAAAHVADAAAARRWCHGLVGDPPEEPHRHRRSGPDVRSR